MLVCIVELTFIRLKYVVICAMAFHVSLGRFMYDHKPQVTLSKSLPSTYDPFKVCYMYMHMRLRVCKPK